MKQTITKAEYLQLVGLLMLAGRYNQMLGEVHAAARYLTGEQDDMGHTYDAVFSGEHDAERLLERLGITVEDPDPPFTVGVP